jgi:hypothetical protein
LVKENTDERPQASFWIVYRDEVKEFLKVAMNLLEWYPKEKAKLNLRITTAFIFLLSVITITVGVLTFYGSVSGDAFVFLIGAFAGYIFSFLSDYLGIGVGG